MPPRRSFDPVTVSDRVYEHSELNEIRAFANVVKSVLFLCAYEKVGNAPTAPGVISTALAKNKRVTITDNDAAKRAIALTSLFHLMSEATSRYTLCNCSACITPTATAAAMTIV